MSPEGGTGGAPGGGRLLGQGALDGLAPRLAALLTVALLPLGLIALDQTRGLSQEAERRAGLSLLSLTEDGAAPLQRAVERALGSAEALAGVAGGIDPGGIEGAGACAAALGGVAGAGRPYGFAGIIPRQGPVTCSTSEAPFEVRDPAALAARLADPRPRVRLPDPGSPVAAEVLLVTAPFGGPRPLGEVALSVRRAGIAPPPPASPAETPAALIVFNAAGEVVDPVGGAPGLLPEGLALAAQAGGGPRVFAADDAGGEPRVYTVAPLLPGSLYAMGVWSPDQGGAGGGWAAGWATAPILFPLGMWLSSLLVAFWAANRLVVRPVGGLVQRMHRFAADRSLPDETVPDDSPRELREIERAFRETAHAILHDEARMEEAFRERGVLLREVHHRVKNNLQLISSIISMQMRRTPEARTRLILRRLQDRVLTLAAIYRSLYTSPDMGDVSVAPILRAIVEQEAANHPGRVSLSLRLEELVLDPDKAVPLAFLVAEAASNAVAQAAQAPGGRWVGVTLARLGPCARVEVVNAVGQPAPGGAAVPLDPVPPGPAPRGGSAGGSSGLGSRLIEAFASQLGGRAEAGREDGTYRLAVTFSVDDVPLGEGDGAGDRLSA